MRKREGERKKEINRRTGRGSETEKWRGGTMKQIDNANKDKRSHENIQTMQRNPKEKEAGGALKIYRTE